MRYWDTPDDATNANLGYLESLSTNDRPPIDVEQVNDLFGAVIRVTRMLPAAVMRHFDLPSLYIGGSAERWNADKRLQEVSRLCEALRSGLDLVFADATLQKGGGANFSDRPRTKGESVLDALEAFKREFPDRSYSSSLAALSRAAAGTRMNRDVTTIEKIVSRKRWSGPNSPEYEVYRAVGAIEFYAARFHHEPD
jgi:hypothetical protein